VIAIPSGIRLPNFAANRLRTIACGFEHTLALRSDGALYGAGGNSYGQLANGSHNFGNSSFVKATNTDTWISVAGGGRHSLVLHSNGSVFGAGHNDLGQLGNQASNDSSSLVQAIGISDAVMVACGYRHSIAVHVGGGVFAAGSGGCLGDNSTLHRSTFVQALGISQAVAVASGYFHSLVLRADGLVFATGGANSVGQCGTGSTVARSTFVQAVGISDAIAVACGAHFSFAIRADGLLFAAGYNDSGQLGLGSTVNHSTFVAATGVSNVIAVAAGWAHTLALRSDGLIFACGFAQDGVLGQNSSAANRSTFVQMTGISDAVAISCGYTHGIALRASGQLFAVGNNSVGKLADATGTNRSTFVQCVEI
jgi:alpha-tubulin suppressor-like RCC1 family protein